MQVFLTNPDNLNQSAKDLDDKRLKKQIVEICQIITANFNINNGSTNVGHANHPITRWYNSEQAVNFLISYGFSICLEIEHRFSKIHQNQFTLGGFSQAYLNFESKKFKPAFIKGRKEIDQVITTENVGELYQQLLISKWNKENPTWTNRSKPEWYRKDE